MHHLVVDGDAALRAHKAMRLAFARGAATVTQTLSTPAGTIRDARVLVRRDLDLWAYFAGGPDERDLVVTWFGIGLPKWQAVIEINIPMRRNLNCYGQLVSDDAGDIHLAHRGGLGGGKYTVATGPFADLINGFEREPVQDGKKFREYFILGRLSEPRRLLESLQAYIHEAAKIRELRRNERAFERTLKSVGGTTKATAVDGNGEYKDELTGKGTYWVNRQVQFNRIHGQVQRALAKEMDRRGLNYGNQRQRHGLGPDLYTKDRRGRMSHLFEIKVGRDSQSTFTALGQLLVYAAGEKPSPIPILVSRGLPRSPKFELVLKSQRIRTIIYVIDGQSRVKFFGIDQIFSN